MIIALLLVMFIMESTNAEDTYSNPVLVESITFSNTNAGANQFTGTMGIGDPAVIFHEEKYYLYPTGDNRGYDVYVSSDLINWHKGPRVFRTDERGAWAPDVFFNTSDRTFYLYYTVNRRIGVATSDRPDGIFEDQGSLIKGAIDAHMFLDEDGRYYLYYVKFPAFQIYVQPMGNPVKKKGEPVQVIKPTEPWENKQAAITEAPWMLKHNGIYYLLYSGGGADTQDYAIGYATSKSPAGPFNKHQGNPIVKKGNGLFGPGHCSVTKSRDGKLWMVYHQQRDESRGWDRIISIDPLWFDERGVLHAKATRGTLQPSPVTSFQEKLSVQ
jgi:beta-xylosidase